MILRVERCQDETLWRQVGRDANRDLPEYADAAVMWPIYDSPHNAGLDLSTVARVDGRPVGRLQRRGETLLEVAVAPAYRRRGVGVALVNHALDDARIRGVARVRVHLYVDEEDAPALALFGRLGFARSPVFSMLADLAGPVPPAAQERARRLSDQGFRARVLDGRAADDVALAAAMQARHFPGAPGYMSETQMVRVFLERGGTAMVLERAGECAGFLLGVVLAATKNGRFVRREGYGLLASIATSERFRRIGVAGTILGAFIDLLKREPNPGVRYLLYGGGGPEGDPSRGVAESVGARREVRHFALSRSTAAEPTP
jgi:ribosomal protein S18 acetylase RimI-like enzyme